MRGSDEDRNPEPVRGGTSRRRGNAVLVRSEGRGTEALLVGEGAGLDSSGDGVGESNCSRIAAGVKSAIDFVDVDVIGGGARGMDSITSSGTEFQERVGCLCWWLKDLQRV